MNARRVTLAIVCLITMLASVAGTLAQDKTLPGQGGFGGGRMHGQDRGPRPFPPDPTFAFVGSEMRFGGPVVKGAPYSATITTESVQTLSNGTKISHKTSASVYRDSDGRTRREQTFGAIGPFPAAGDPPQMTFIEDPVAGAHYVLDAKNHTAQKMKINSGAAPKSRPPSTSQAKTESLGTKTIEGVEAEGTRSTITIPAGQIGNDQPVEIVSERWYSPELQVVVMSKHTDPRMGDHTYKLTNINRSEPAKSLFEVPADYTVTEGSFNRGPRPTRRPPEANEK